MQNDDRLSDLPLASDGNIMIACVTSLMLLCIVFCIIQFSITLRMANEASIQIEDGLTASCMAGLSIDLQKFADTFITGKADVVVNDVLKSYSLFSDTLKINLSTDSNELFHNVRVKQYIIYNIYWDRTMPDSDKKNMDIYFFDENGLVNEIHKQYEDVYSPNGIKVTRTSVYADILFDLEIFAGQKNNCHKQMLTQAYKK